MYLRRHQRKKKNELYEYWTLVESVRTERGPRQRVVATLGKSPGVDEQTRVGWEHIGEILGGKARRADFFDSRPEPPSWAHVDLSGVRVERVRRFGEVYLALALWRRLGLDAFFNEAMEPGREEIPWSTMACVLTLARFCAPSSELQIAQSWYGKTALDEMLGVGADKINDDRLYRARDALEPHKDGLFKHLQGVYGELFGVSFDVLLYDVTSTYFEGQVAANDQARRGYSRDSRPDCKQVCIALVVTPQGLPLAYEVFDGNRTDVTTVEEIVETMRTKYGQERRVWVMDRGMVSEDNLEMLREAGACYIVGTPKSMLKKFERELLGEDWVKVQPEVEVKLCEAPGGQRERFVLCRSRGRIEKDRAIRVRQVEKLQAELTRLAERAEAEVRPLRDRAQAERRVGRLFERYPAAARLFEVAIEERPDPQKAGKPRLSVKVIRHPAREGWAELTDGCYLLRTNLTDHDPEQLWKTYIGLTQIEDCFRITKHDLGLRPIYHQRADRTRAHILVCFVSLAMWRTLQHWMQAAGLGTAPRKLLEEMAEVRSMDVVLPVGPDRQGRKGDGAESDHHAERSDTRTMDEAGGAEVRLRVVARPEKPLAILLHHLDLPLPTRPKRIQNVVQTFDPKNAIS